MSLQPSRKDARGITLGDVESSLLSLRPCNVTVAGLSSFYTNSMEAVLLTFKDITFVALGALVFWSWMLHTPPIIEEVDRYNVRRKRPRTIGDQAGAAIGAVVIATLCTLGYAALRGLVLYGLGIPLTLLILKLAAIVTAWTCAWVFFPWENATLVVKAPAAWLFQKAALLSSKARDLEHRRKNAAAELAEVQAQLEQAKNDPYFKLAMGEIEALLGNSDAMDKLLIADGSVPRDVLRQARVLAEKLTQSRQ